MPIELKRKCSNFQYVSERAFFVSILVFMPRALQKIPARNRLTLLKKLFTGAQK